MIMYYIIFSLTVASLLSQSSTFLGAPLDLIAMTIVDLERAHALTPSLSRNIVFYTVKEVDIHSMFVL